MSKQAASAVQNNWLLGSSLLHLWTNSAEVAQPPKLIGDHHGVYHTIIPDAFGVLLGLPAVIVSPRVAQVRDLHSLLDLLLYPLNSGKIWSKSPILMSVSAVTRLQTSHFCIPQHRSLVDQFKTIVSPMLTRPISSPHFNPAVLAASFQFRGGLRTSS